MLRIAGILNPIGHVRAKVSSKRRTCAQQPFIDRLEVRASWQPSRRLVLIPPQPLYQRMVPWS